MSNQRNPVTHLCNKAPERYKARAISVMSNALVNNGILPKGAFEITSTDQKPFVLTQDGDIALTQLTVKVPDLSMVNIGKARDFVTDIEMKASNPLKPVPKRG